MLYGQGVRALPQKKSQATDTFQKEYALGMKKPYLAASPIWIEASAWHFGEREVWFLVAYH